jgi:general secretion pathway protein E
MDDLPLLAVIAGGAAVGLMITWVLGVVLPARRKLRKDSGEVTALDDTLISPRQEPLRHLQEVRSKVRAKLKAGPTQIPDILDYIVVQCHNLGASDVHITPMPSSINIELRLDGLLYGVAVLPKEHQEVVFRRLKVLARLDVFARDKPQDGHINEIAGQNVDIRISTLPVAHGEKAVLRLLSSGSGQLDLDQLGLTADRLSRYREITERPQGLIILTGPTGSGKTTTMYASLRELKDRRRASLNIVTIEDPIETGVAILNQTQVNEATGLTFARGLRAILRQDPDVIMVGEIRDAETAQIATQAGLTGHLIFTSIHADSAVGVFNRLINMGVEPFLVASSTAAVLSQRLVRRLCPRCRQQAPLADHHRHQLERMGVEVGEEALFWVGAGCESCLGKGDQGRIGLFELLVVDDAMRSELIKQVPTHQLNALATSRGMQTLLDDGLEKARRGDVSIAEVLRVVV